MVNNRSAVVAAPVAGVLLGVLDFVWIKYVPSPFADLGNSIAVWAVAAFLLTFRFRWSLPVGVVGAIVCLVVAVPFYYLAATVIQNDDLSNAYNSTALMWMGLGVVAGAVFGAAGVLARTPGRLQTAALAMPGAVMFAEAVIQLRRIGNPSYDDSGQVQSSLVLIALGLLVIWLAGRSWPQRGLALLIAVPFTAIGWVLLSFTGFR
ncbi:DUF6518 family protein [Paractinoplanes brasiliensis]|uniref:Uncharacterized protein n=1 Tax=Paractinoplanes brasiliensis TaxID=52695 RepID=A0A4R6JXD7_9ACTN|nr:DUF6518 family protein [Actinoplanes brasiliensis]TDO39886.1 hypothetical protein C8E87_3591 [Actinoplanes brasiliensis]GID31505.1 hypothetical protein Abr02nite_64880 [Actinoplanes brasiliensis]